MSKALVIVAFHKEIGEPKEETGKLWSLSSKVDICICGVGINQPIPELSKYDTIYNVGTCGTIPDKAKVGDIIFPSETGELYLQLQSFYGIKKTKIEIRQGICKTMDSVCTKVPRKIGPADVIDMEYEKLLQMCLQEHKPLIAVKVVSDTIGRKHKDIDICVERQVRTIKNIIKNIIYIEGKK